MLKTMAALIALVLVGCAAASTKSSNMNTVEFVVRSDADLGIYFDSKVERFILPEFAKESDNYEISRVWQRWEAAGLFDSQELFCTCRGEYMKRGNRRWFRVVEAEYFYDKRSRWQ